MPSESWLRLTGTAKRGGGRKKVYEKKAEKERLQTDLMESSRREERGCVANTDRGSRSGPWYHSQGRPRGCLMIWQTEQAAVQTLLHRWKKTGEEGMTEDGSADLSYKNVSSVMPPPAARDIFLQHHGDVWCVGGS